MGDRVSEFGRDMKLAAALEDLQGELTLAEPTRSRAGDFMELTKARLNMMVLITTMIGFVVGKITVDEGPSLWRIRPRAQGRANWIQRRTSHVEVVLKEV